MTPPTEPRTAAGRMIHLYLSAAYQRGNPEKPKGWADEQATTDILALEAEAASPDSEALRERDAIAEDEQANYEECEALRAALERLVNAIVVAGPAIDDFDPALTQARAALIPEAKDE
jgi:hypothetical protein